MARSTRVLGSLRAVSSGRGAALVAGVVLCLTASCTVQSQSGISQPDLPGGSVGGFAGGSFTATDPPCTPPFTATPVFAEQVLSSTELFGREFYSWTTDEQSLALRQNQALFAQPAAPGTPFTLLSTVAFPPTVEELALALSSAFANGRYGWPEPWAMRMSSSGADPGGQLLRIVIKPEAWVAIVGSQSLSVFDAQKQLVSTDEALAHPENIGVLYYDSSLLNPLGCGAAKSERGFLLGNLSMVQEWSLGTQQIADRLNANITQLTRFLNATRSCPVTTDAASWAQNVVCSWQGQWGAMAAPAADGTDLGAAGTSGATPSAGGAASGSGGAFAGSASFAGSFAAPAQPGSGGAFIGAGGEPSSFNPADFGGLQSPNTEEFAYDQALTAPSASYLAAPAQIATIIETLQGDLFEPDPLVVTPGSP